MKSVMFFDLYELPHVQLQIKWVKQVSLPNPKFLNIIQGETI